MKQNTIKQYTISQIREVLHKNNTFYTSSDFPFIQLEGFYITYQAKVMNRFLHERGFIRVKGSEIDFNKLDCKVHGNRNVYLTYNNYLRYKKEKIKVL